MSTATLSFLVNIFAVAFVVLRAEGVEGKSNSGRELERLLFKHNAPHRLRRPSFYADLRLELISSVGRRRKLLQQNDIKNLRISELDSLTGIDVLEAPAGQLSSWMLQALREHPGVDFVEEDSILSAYSAVTLPNDPNLEKQWAMYQLGLFQPDTDLQSSSIGQHQVAWERTEGSQNISVCIIDSGVDYTHPDLLGNIWTNIGEIPWNGIDDDRNGFIDDFYGYNFLNDSGNVMDDNFHGTHLAGIVGARTDNKLGVAGVSPQVKVMACKFLDSHGNGYTSDAIRCMSYALQMGAQITLNSYGGIGANSLSLLTAVQNAEKAGQLFVTAAGNDYGADLDALAVYPANYNNTNVMAVIATDEDGDLASYSNFGRKTAHIAAPGTNILSTVPNGAYGYHDGTSQAAAFIAGAAALLLAAYQDSGFPVSGLARALKANIMDGAVVRQNLVNTSITGGTLDIAAAMALVPLTNTSRLPTNYNASAVPSYLVNEVLETARAVKNLTEPYDVEQSVTASASVPQESHVPPLWLSAMLENGTQAQSIAFIQQGRGAYGACQQQEESLPNDPAFGLDVTAAISKDAASGFLVDLPEGVVIGPSLVWRVAVFANGTVHLLESYGPSLEASPDDARPPSLDGLAPEPGYTSQPVAFRIYPFLADGPDLSDGGQASYFLRPDRLVVSFVQLPMAGSEVSFQIEVFTRPGRFPPGSVRITYTGQLEEPTFLGAGQVLFRGRVDDLMPYDVIPCLRPPTLEFQPTMLPPVKLSSTRPTVDLPVELDNPGNATLDLWFEVEPRAANLLRPELWLNPATEYGESFAASNLTCQQYETGLDPVCQVFTRPAGGAVAMRGAWLSAPMLYADSLKLPLRICAGIERNRQCSNHFLVLSAQKTPPAFYGESGSLWLLMLCSKKYIYTASESRASNTSCADFGSNVLDIWLTSETVEIADDFCPGLQAPHQLPPGPLYLFIGALCEFETCEGGTQWDWLDVLAFNRTSAWQLHPPSPLGLSPAQEERLPAPLAQMSAPTASSPPGNAGTVDDEIPAPAQALQTLEPMRGPGPSSSAETASSTPGFGLPLFDAPSWVVPQPEAGSIRPQSGRAAVLLRFSGEGTSTGLYNASLAVHSNDPDQSVRRLDLQMEASA